MDLHKENNNNNYNNNNNNSHNSTRYKKILKLYTFAAVQFHSQTYVSVPS